MQRSEALAYLHLAHFFDHLFLLIFPTAAIALAADWGIGYGAALAYGTPVYLLFALGTLPAGWLGDRLDRMRLIALFFLGCGAASLLVALASGPVALMAALGALGLFAAIYHPVGLALVPELALRPGRALAVNGVFGNLGLAGAAVITGFLAARGGWQSAFVLPGILSLLIGAIMLLRGRRAGAPARPQIAPAGGGAAAPAPARRVQLTVFGVVCVSALFGGLVFNALTVALPKFLDERLTGLGGDLAWVGAAAGAVFAIAAFAQLPVGELLDRHGARPILITLLAGQLVLLLVLAQAEGWTVLALALLLVTLVFAEIPITSWLLGRYVQPGLRSRAISVAYVLSLGVGAGVVPLSAVLHQRGLGFAMQFLGLALAVAVTLAAAWLLPRAPAGQEAGRLQLAG